MDNTSDVVKTLIQTQMIAAFNQGPDLIEKLVKAALSKEVDSLTGKTDGYHGHKVPYIDYLVGEEIRTATRVAVSKVVSDHADTIEQYVREGLNAETVVDAIAKSIIGAAGQDWRIQVKFAVDDRR